MSERIRGYRAFWHYYVAEHSRAGTRRLHFVGTTGAVALVVAAAVTGEPLLLPAALVCGYLFAWLSHLLIERNRPATFTYPLFSLAGDFHMWALMWQAAWTPRSSGWLPRASQTSQHRSSAASDAPLVTWN